MTLPHLICFTSLGSVVIWNIITIYLFSAFFPKSFLVSSFWRIKKKTHRIISSGNFNFFLLLSVIRDFSFNHLSCFSCFLKSMQRGILTRTCLTPSSSSPLLVLLRRLLISPAGIQFGTQPSIPPKHRGTLSLAYSHRITVTATPGSLSRKEQGSADTASPKDKFGRQESRGIARFTLAQRWGICLGHSDKGRSKGSRTLCLWNRVPLPTVLEIPHKGSASQLAGVRRKEERENRATKAFLCLLLQDAKGPTQFYIQQQGSVVLDR